MSIETTSPHRTLLYWWVLAIVPGLFFAPLGVPTAGLAAWRAPRSRTVFLVIAVVWLFMAVFMTAYPWTGASVSSGGGR